MDLSYVTILSLLAILTLSIIWYLNKSSKHGGKTPPGPWGLPILGYLPFMEKNLLNQLADLAHKYGPIYKMYLGSKLHVVISSPSLVREVVRDRDEIFGNRDPPIAVQATTYDGNDIAWSPLNSKWRELRKAFVREVMSNTSLEASWNLRRVEVRKAVKQCYEDQKPVDIGQMLFKTVLNIITNILWGGVLEGEGGQRVGAEFQTAILKLIEIAGKPNISDFLPSLAWLDIQGIKRQTVRHMSDVDRILNEVLAEHEDKLSRGTTKEGKKDFIQTLVELKESTGESNISLSKKQYKALILDIVSAATDTSSITIEWAMAELLNNPKYMEKAKQELTDVVGLDNMVEEHHLPKLKYLESVFKETLRSHPAAPLLIPRSPSKTSTIGGYTIPENTRVLINAPFIHRDPHSWDKPLDFKPERFLNNDKERFDFSGNNFQYIPFGSGRRMCPGLPLAEKLVMYLLASLLHSFDWKLSGDERLDMSEEFKMMLRKRVPLVAVPSARLSDSSLYD